MFGGLQRVLFGSKETQSRQDSRPTARYMRPDSSNLLGGWRPALRSQRQDVKEAWTGVAARAIDAAHNSGWITGAIEQMVADINGPEGLTINVAPDHQALRWSYDFAYAWASDVEREFVAYANSPLECDARGKATLATMADAIVRWYMPFGEGLGRILLRERAGATMLTKVQLVSPIRLSQQSSELEDLHQGVFLDGDGQPIGYRFRARANGYDQDLDVAARDPDGRPLVVHVFDGDPDATRGISPFAPALKVTRQYDQLADATLTTALLQTIFAATFESAQLPAEALEGLLTENDFGAGSGGQVDPTAPGGMAALMGARAEWYGASGIDLGTHGRIATMFPGDQLKFTTAETPGSNYLPFSQNLNREIARCIGTSYEKYTGDYQGATFSSIKMSIASDWPVVVRRRRVIPRPFLQAVFEAWLEERIARGLTPYPGGYSRFLKQRAAATRATWRGPAKPSPDELKTAMALKVLVKDLGVMSVSTAAGEIGLDADAEQQQRAQDRATAIRLNLPDPYAPPPGSLPSPDPAKLLEDAEDGPARRP
ncbi:phage portal protein [Brevundimonas sp.]|uniref:phage portal protein n=1 Tax=Brevundimonas sp. TaxID=1871086 RepID=UPI00286B4483|nr:phage portal protein [Brevundimonas sp.]